MKLSFKTTNLAFEGIQAGNSKTEFYTTKWSPWFDNDGKLWLFDSCWTAWSIYTTAFVTTFSRTMIGIRVKNWTSLVVTKTREDLVRWRQRNLDKRHMESSPWWGCGVSSGLWHLGWPMQTHDHEVSFYRKKNSFLPLDQCILLGKPHHFGGFFCLSVF